MCGIAGIISNNPNKSRFLKTALDLQRHRGPDGEGTYEGDNVGLAHSRLSILDLEGGRQPMESPRSVVVFNGEIYNYKELRHELKPKGYIFKSESDTEVVLHGFEAWGPNLFIKLRGMFALAILNKVTSEITLARDPFGIKPLHYFHNQEEFAFSSEINPLKSYYSNQISHNTDALIAFLHLQYIPSPKSAFHEIKKLEAGTYLCVDGKGKITKNVRFFIPETIPTREKTDVFSYQEAVKKTKEILIESVNAHMLADVEIGTFLSGGVDSTLITLLASELSPGKINSFSIGFAEAEFDESAYSTEAAKVIGTHHHHLVIDSITEADVLDLVAAHGEPFGDSSGIPTYFVSKLASNQVKVALTGDGADELFFGYDRYAAWEKKTARFSEIGSVKRRYVRTMRGLRPQRYGYMSGEPNFEAWSKSMETFPVPSLRELTGLDSLMDKNPVLLDCKKWFNDCSAYSEMDCARRAEIRYYLREDILTKVDIASMRNSLETRPPFVDVRVWEWARSLPESYLFQEGLNSAFIGKRILKDILADRFPSTFIHRPKMGFGIPLDAWINKGNLRDLYRAAIFSSEAPLRQIIDQKAIQHWHAHQIEQGPGAPYSQWVLLVLNAWLMIKPKMS